MDLDIEMDIDYVQDAPAIPEAYTHDIITGEEQEPGEIDDDEVNKGDGDAELAQQVVLNKVHLRGLDTFTPDDIKQYVGEHFGVFDKIEWIDDSSANIVFKSESLAQDALVSLAEIKIDDPTQMPAGVEVRAKPSATKPEALIQARFAVASDKKAAGAASRSRFYLLNPEYDPEERRRRGEFNNRKYRDRDDGRGRDRRNGRRRDQEDDDEPRNTFDVNLYDDDPEALARRILQPRQRSRRRSRSRSRTRTRSRRDSISSTSTASPRPSTNKYSRSNREKELFPDRRSRSGLQSRNRSASPLRDRDGDAHMDMDDEARHSAALRSREKGRSIKERLSAENRQRELFPSKAVAKDSGPKELFPSKVSAPLEGKAQMDQMAEATTISSAKLADRVTQRGSTPATGSSSFSIRGTANKRSADQGFTIKGTGTTVKELFPEKFGNAGKELFAEKLEGRGRRRQKAEDLFY
ncbi:Protein of unknown function (DUF2414) domain containing protein [Rhypophila decipiens]